MGLIKAVDRYDPDLGPFVRYAVPNVMGELKRHFRDKGWGMHVPRSVQERFLQVNDAMDELSGRLGRSPAPKDIAEHTGLAVEDVLEALEAATAYLTEHPAPDLPRRSGHGDHPAHLRRWPSPDARATGRATAARIVSSVPARISRDRARVTAV